MSGRVLKIFNLFFHVFPLLIFLMLYDTRIKSDNLYLAVFSLLIYLLLFNPINIYNYKCKKCVGEKVSSSLILIYMAIIALIIIKQKIYFNILMIKILILLTICIIFYFLFKKYENYQNLNEFYKLNQLIDTEMNHKI